MDFKELIGLIDKVGFKGAISTIIIFILYSITKSKWLSAKLEKVTDWGISLFIKTNVKEIEAVKKIKVSDIENHEILNYINYWMYSEIPTIEFPTEYRKAVFRKYLFIMFKTYKANLEVYILSKEYTNMDEPELFKSFLSFINRTVYEYEKEMENANIPSIIIEKMKVKNNENILLILDLVSQICNAPFYHSEQNLLRVFSILNIMQTVLENTLTNSVSVCNSINGSLKGMTFDGKTE